MKRNNKIQQITPDLNHKSWEELYRFKQHCSKVSKKIFKQRSFEEFKNRKLYMLKTGMDVYVVWDKEKGGFFSFKIGCKDDIQRRHTKFKSELINDQFDETILKLILNKFLNHDNLSKYFVYTTTRQDYEYFRNILPIKLGEIRELYELNINASDMETIEEWYNSFQDNNENFSLNFYEDLPEDLIAKYSKLLTEFIKEAPFKSKLFDYDLAKESAIIRRKLFYKKVNYKWYQYLLFDKKRELIGLTDALINANNPKIISQSMTGIKTAHRNKGLSKWMKAAMFKKILNDYPNTEKLITAIHPKNFIPKKINMKMGFKKYNESNELLISKNDIVNYCNGSKN